MEQVGGGGGGNEVVEEASPISSRPPASNNLEELMRFSAAADDGGGGGGGGGGGSASSSSGNRWPREETLALLRIRSDMDSTFRDATLKAPLWEHVSRKLLELGYKRSAKKCKEKFENVQKYYKRTKETRGGRHDGKAYKFFSQLEALNTTPTPLQPHPHPPSSSLDVTPLSVANPILMPSSSSSPFPIFSQPQPQTQPPQTHTVSFTPTPLPPPPPMAPTFPGVTFSSHSSSTASGMGSDDDDDEDMDVDQTNIAGSSSRKRKRGNRGGGKMMELFEGLVRQVMQKQAAMQRSFLEALEKREQERLDREEAWKRQEMSRLAREHEVMAQERAASASRDAAIISLIQKITGHTIQLPPSLSSQTPQIPPHQPPQPPPAAKRAHQEPQLSTAQSQLQQPIMAIPQQQILPSPHLPHQPEQKQQQQQQQVQEMIVSSEQSSLLPSSSRWPKAEILALINLRSGMEPRYQDNVPKGLLWEEISTSMKRMGYNRNAKRCKEKWENINKYYKKVKESNKKRPQDAKTCPYFHRLDLLYRNKVLGGSGGGGGSSTSGLPQEQKQSPVSAIKPPQEGVLNVQPHESGSSEEVEPIDQESTPQGTEKKTL
ncbi:trihelix transcription factor GTL1 isoform X2 [Capsella rubella]|uniref:trihelix transcription factor GTL1 isoform X2 n=1 Tax=Capsella rubella TaxID=81985 RepID=UPI000CD56C3B|nr:trihelix transcription factor GTL1 isoform X2 [Capsella rubella]